eukprot:GCRY01002991.1.p1 GENE.GCRY01002991.1~~GCRY01002991.1.p1  ORF type:complete len:797 (-),score=119.46 GCRY01002991.1:7-2397(-)
MEQNQQVDSNLEWKNPSVFDKADFDATKYINVLFPNEHSLSKIMEKIETLSHFIEKEEEHLLSTVKTRSLVNKLGKNEVEIAQTAIKDLFDKIEEIRLKAKQSEEMVQEICSDVRSLDNAKKNLTVTVSIIKKLNMFVSAVEQVKNAALRDNFQQAASFLDAVVQLALFFEKHKQTAALADIFADIEVIKRDLKANVMMQFRSVDFRDGVRYPPCLPHCCQVADILGPSAREDILSWYKAVILGEYKRLFPRDLETSGFEHTERRFAWLSKILKDADLFHTCVFPSSWRIQEFVANLVCVETAHDITYNLSHEPDAIDVTVFLRVLSHTLEFEKTLTLKINSVLVNGTEYDGSENEMYEESENVRQRYDREAVEALDPSSLAAIKAKYRHQRREKRQAEHSQRQNCNSPSDVVVLPSNFVGMMSASFEPFMGMYIEMEDRNITDMLEKSVQDEEWVVSADAGNVLVSASNIFYYFKKTLKRAAALSTGKPLVDIHGLFRQSLEQYANVLKNRLPRGGDIPRVSSGSSEWHITLTVTDLREILAIINTADYCHSTVVQLEATLSKTVQESFVDLIDLQLNKDMFYEVVTLGCRILVVALETGMDRGLTMLSATNWARLESIADQSDFVNHIRTALTTIVPLASELLTSLHFTFFIEKFIQSFSPRLYMSLLKIKRLPELGAVQLTVDLEIIRKMLMETVSVPESSRHHIPDRLMNQLSSCLQPSQSLVKIIRLPVDNIPEAYRALFPDGSASELQKLLEMKGLKRTEIQPLLEVYDESARLAPGAVKKLFNKMKSVI